MDERPERIQRSMARNASDLRLPELRRGLGRWQGKCEACGEWNTIAEEGSPQSPRDRPGRHGAQGPSVRARAARRRDARGPAPALRHCRTRPRHRRRLRARLGAAGRRRSRHRQIDVAASRPPPRLPARGHRAVYISGEEAVAQVRLRAERLGLRRRRRSSSPPRPRSRTSSRRCRQGETAAPRRHQFDPDHVDRRGRIRARHRDPGARLAPRR